ncbi:MAG: alginate export family protein [Caulobacterales bacterium]
MSRGALAMALVAGARAWADPPTPASAPDLVRAVEQGRPILDLRTRYEDVNQAGLASAAPSLTPRLQLGWETASFHGFRALVEFAGDAHLDSGRYNVAIPGGASLNGRTQFPVINDPAFATLNRAQLSWTPSKLITLTVGRQRILIDDQRFVGNSGWRQDEQRFDAVRADLSLGPLKGTYAYVWRVDRIFGGELDWASDSHLLDVSYQLVPQLKAEGFVYALDFRNTSPTALANAALNSSLTTGARVTGAATAGPVKLTYDAAWARQHDYRGRTGRFALDYWQADFAATWGIATLRGDYEQLDGNGARGFSTPIGTTHAFQGWADAFASTSGNKTHVDGIRDVNATFILRPDWKLKFFSHPEALVRYHDFNAELTGAYLASEWDAQAQAAITPQLTAAVKFARFQRATSVPVGTVAAPASRTKLWFTLEYRL